MKIKDNFLVKIYITITLMIILIIIAFIFGSQNDQIITLNYLVARAEIPVAVAVSIFTCIGFFLGLFVALLWKLVRMVKPKNKILEVKGQ
jgi:putative membrane protein